MFACRTTPFCLLHKGVLTCYKDRLSCLHNPLPAYIHDPVLGVYIDAYLHVIYKLSDRRNIDKSDPNNNDMSDESGRQSDADHLGLPSKSAQQDYPHLLC